MKLKREVETHDPKGLIWRVSPRQKHSFLFCPICSVSAKGCCHKLAKLGQLSASGTSNKKEGEGQDTCKKQHLQSSNICHKNALKEGPAKYLCLWSFGLPNRGVLQGVPARPGQAPGTAKVLKRRLCDEIVCFLGRFLHTLGKHFLHSFHHSRHNNFPTLLRPHSQLMNEFKVCQSLSQSNVV